MKGAGSFRIIFISNKIFVYHYDWFIFHAFCSVFSKNGYFLSSLILRKKLQKNNLYLGFLSAQIV